MSIKKNQRYAYEKAIEAYWHHMNRYHAWMNYYALFNGALFVGYCTLLTATSYITQLNEKFYCLTNNYQNLTLLLSILGIVASLCWLVSIKGHEMWEINWMNIIEKYEKECGIKVYKLIVMDEQYMGIKGNGDKLHKVLDSEDYFKAFSTHSATKNFIFCIIIGWIIAFFSVFDTNVCTLVMLGTIVFVVGSVLNKTEILFKYSNVKGKYWEKK